MSAIDTWNSILAQTLRRDLLIHTRKGIIPTELYERKVKHVLEFIVEWEKFKHNALINAITSRIIACEQEREKLVCPPWWKPWDIPIYKERLETLNNLLRGLRFALSIVNDTLPPNAVGEGSSAPEDQGKEEQPKTK